MIRLEHTTHIVLFVFALRTGSGNLRQLAVQIIHIGRSVYKHMLLGPLHQLVLRDIACVFLAQWVVNLLGKLYNDWIFWIVFAVFDVENEREWSANA